MQNQMRETARTVVTYLPRSVQFLLLSPPERSTVNLLGGLAPLAPQTRGPCAARKLAQIVAAKSSPACRRPRAISPTVSQRLTRKRRTKDGIAVSFSTVTPDCQELDWHDTRTDTRLAPGALPRGRARGRSVTSLSSAWCRSACCLLCRSAHGIDPWVQGSDRSPNP